MSKELFVLPSLLFLYCFLNYHLQILKLLHLALMLLLLLLHHFVIEQMQILKAFLLSFTAFKINSLLSLLFITSCISIVFSFLFFIFCYTCFYFYSLLCKHFFMFCFYIIFKYGFFMQIICFTYNFKSTFF